MAAKYRNDEVIVRQAKRDDMKHVVQLIQELADFEKMSDGPKLTVKDLERDCFEVQPPAFLCKVAEVVSDGHLAGYAIYFPTYSTWVGKTLFLEDLYVRNVDRRRGVGERLFDAVAKEAAAVGPILDFHVLEWNPARGFYETKGAKDLQEWYYCRLFGQQLKEVAIGQKKLPTSEQKYKNDDISIRSAKKEDMEQVSQMIHEFAEYENLSGAPQLTVGDLERDLFETQPPAFMCMVGEVVAERRLAAFGVYYRTYSTWEGVATALQALYVREGDRRKGLGGRMFDAIAKDAASVGTRLDMHVSAGSRARELCRVKGAANLTLDEQWRYYRLHVGNVQ